MRSNRNRQSFSLQPNLLALAFAALLSGVITMAGIDFAMSATNGSSSARSFRKAYAVLMHPRCMNCHPAGDHPLVGDKSMSHPMNIKRGPEGMGTKGLLCSGCHQEKNLPGAHTPPGAPGWQLPTADLPMVFQTRTPKQLCEQLKDPARNGNRDLNQVLEHVREAPLVLWAWDPGDGRTPVPVSHEQFVKDMTDWVKKGAACPEK